eukprot:jgi/Tetstr1/466151/TSEL_010712.t1
MCAGSPTPHNDRPVAKSGSVVQASGNAVVAHSGTAATLVVYCPELKLRWGSPLPAGHYGNPVAKLLNCNAHHGGICDYQYGSAHDFYSALCRFECVGGLNGAGVGRARRPLATLAA